MAGIQQALHNYVNEWRGDFDSSVAPLAQEQLIGTISEANNFILLYQNKRKLYVAKAGN